MSAFNNSNTFVNVKLKLTNSYIEALVLEKRRARRDGKFSRSPSAKLRLTEASNKLRNTLHQEEDQKATIYIESPSRSQTTKYSPWKATKAIRPPVESETHLRKLNGIWARCADEEVILYASHISEVFQPNPTKNEFCLSAIQEVQGNTDSVQVEGLNQIVKNK